MGSWCWWVLSVVLGLRLAAILHAWWSSRRMAKETAQQEKWNARMDGYFAKLREREAMAAAHEAERTAARAMMQPQTQDAPSIAAVLPNGEPMTREASRAWLREQGQSEIVGAGDGGPFAVALPGPVPLHPRPVEGEEQHVKVTPLSPVTLGLMLALAGPAYMGRKGAVS